MRFRANGHKEIPKAKKSFLSFQEYFSVFIKKRRGERSSSVVRSRLKALCRTPIGPRFSVQEKAERARVVIEAESLEEFLKSYAVTSKHSYGTAYWRRRSFSFLSAFVAKYAAFLGKVAWMFSWRSSIAALVAVLVVYIGGMNVSSAPYARTITTKAEWGLGATDNLSLGSATDAIQLAGDGTWSARTWAVPPDTISSGSSSIFLGNDLYVMRGLSDKAFWKYDSALNVWSELSDLPFPVYHGADMVADSANNLNLRHFRWFFEKVLFV